MSIPGANILKMAARVIAQQVVTYFTFTGNTLNEVGNQVPSYDSGAVLKGSFQPVPQNLYTQYGLDLQKTYATFYTVKNVLSVGRGVSGDQLEYAGKRYQVESANDWFAQDGWEGVLVSSIDT